MASKVLFCVLLSSAAALAAADFGPAAYQFDADVATTRAWQKGDTAMTGGSWTRTLRSVLAGGFSGPGNARFEVNANANQRDSEGFLSTANTRGLLQLWRSGGISGANDFGSRRTWQAGSSPGRIWQGRKMLGAAAAAVKQAAQEVQTLQEVQTFGPGSWTFEGAGGSARTWQGDRQRVSVGRGVWN